jgi:hypothetical protein
MATPTPTPTLIPKDFVPGNIPQVYGDVYNTQVEIQGFKVDGSTISKLKKDGGYTTVYPKAADAIDTIISLETNIKDIIKKVQPPIFEVAGFLPTVKMKDPNKSTEYLKSGDTRTITLGTKITLDFTGNGPFDLYFTSSKDGGAAQEFEKTNQPSSIDVDSLETGTFVFNLLRVKDADYENNGEKQTITIVVNPVTP